MNCTIPITDEKIDRWHVVPHKAVNGCEQDGDGLLGLATKDIHKYLALRPMQLADCALAEWRIDQNGDPEIPALPGVVLSEVFFSFH